MSRKLVPVLAVMLAFSLVAASCGDDDDGAGGANGNGDGGGEDGGGEAIDHEALGLWDDGPCDESRDPLVVGLMTVFESPVISLEDQALALEAAAEAFNGRGGANGACIEVHTCDDGGNVDQAVACAREMEELGVHATVNDQGTAGQAEVSEFMAEAGIPRVASNVTSTDWGDQNAYPTDASGTGVVFLLPQALIEEGVTEIGLIRVDLAEAAAMQGLLGDMYDGKATFPFDVPVPAGTTDFSQFILGAENEDVGGVVLGVGEQEAVQVVRAGQQLGTDLLLGSSLGSFAHSNVAELGDFGDQMVFLSPFPPATVDVPVYEALRADLAASGEEALQPENLKVSPMRSWIGLYGLLWMIRDVGMTEFSGEAISTMLQEAEDVPMLGMFGDEDWTPDVDHPGLFQRAGTNHWAIYRWDGDAEAPGGLEGNFVETTRISFDEVLCGTLFGAEEPC